MSTSNQDRYQKLYNRFFKEQDLEYDTSRFNDPIADKTKWGPAMPGGANYRTRKLIQVNDNRIEFRSGCTRKLFGIIFIFLGLVVGGLFAMLLVVDEFRTLATYFAVAAGLLFVVIGIVINRIGNIPIVFDKESGYYWHSRKDPKNVVNLHDFKNLYPLDQIHAIQLIAERMSGSSTSSTGSYSSGSYSSFEINLVLKDANRVNVIDHGDLKQIYIDAEQLSLFLNIPVWNTIE
jgi:hypothetical protein